jgi:tRNA nucleotidyltransferase (CCA-adding enzyme)
MFKELNDRAYQVGGAVRDLLLGRDSKDKDYVLADTTEDDFIRVFPEAKRVGLSFPVFLLNGDEVALAREEFLIEDETMIDLVNAYTNFQVNVGVSIEKDLGRRDFTCNSIAMDMSGNFIDPFDGMRDILTKTLRCVNPVAFVEDPLRIYRGARFDAILGFKMDYETFVLMRANVNGLKGITPDRVYIELKQVYERADKPSRFFVILKALDALKYHFKPLELMTHVQAGPTLFHGENTAFDHAMKSFDYAKSHGMSFDVALAALFHDTGKGVSKHSVDGEEQHHIRHEIMSYAINKKMIEQHRFTEKQNKLIVLFARHHMYFHVLEQVKNPIKLVRFYKKIRRHAADMIDAANCDSPLTDAQYKILLDLEKAFKTTEVVIPESVKKNARNNKSIDRDPIAEFVDNLYTAKYKEVRDDRPCNVENNKLC